jgi:hypothetical protein
MKKVLSIFVAVLLACGLCGGQAYAATGLLGDVTTNTLTGVNTNANTNVNTNTNANVNTNTNANINTNANMNTQGQQQGQLQGQLQGQMQGQGQAIIGSANTANSNNSSQSTSVVFEAKRELAPAFDILSGPNMTEFRGPYKEGNAGKVKPWAIKATWTKDEIGGFYSVSDDASCKVYTLKKSDNKVETLMVSKGGATLAILDCKGLNDMEIWGTAATKALDMGGAAITEAAYSVTFSNKASGWNIGLGGGVSVIGQGTNDNKGGSVGGGTGFGSVETKPVENINVLFFVR